jgi:hypothetical protein
MSLYLYSKAEKETEADKCGTQYPNSVEYIPVTSLERAPLLSTKVFGFEKPGIVHNTRTYVGTQEWSTYWKIYCKLVRLLLV